jgi:hypothetical protein
MGNCVKCGFALEGQESECPRCGVILSKARATSLQTPAPDRESETQPVTTPDGAYLVSREAARALTGVVPWLRLIVLYTFAAIVLMLLASFLVPLLANLSAESVGMALVYLLYAGIALAMVLPLQRSLRGVRELRDSGSTTGLETFVLEQTQFWRRAGVLTAIALVLMVLAIAILVVGVVVTQLA